MGCSLNLERCSRYFRPPHVPMRKRRRMASALTCQARQLLPVQNTRCVLENAACTHKLRQCELAAVVLDTLRHATSLTARRLQTTHPCPQDVFTRACFDSHEVNATVSGCSCHVAVRFSSVGKTLTQTRLDKAKRRTMTERSVRSEIMLLRPNSTR